MASFKLIEKARNHLKVTFHVVNQSGDVLGSINTHTGKETDDLLKCFQGPVMKDSPSPRQRATSPVAALANAFLQAKSRSPFSKAAILRGCQ